MTVARLADRSAASAADEADGGAQDAGHVVSQSWDLGTARRAGLFPRSSAQLQLLTAFGGSGKIAAWCDSNDPYCASGINLEVHLTYLNRYQSAAASFVLSKIGG